MNYCYDILTNFQDDDIYEFYEWEETDNIERIKKVPLFRVDSELFNDFFKYNIQITDEEFLNLIEDKTLLTEGNHTRNIKYAFLLTDTKGSLVIELDNCGIVTYLSKLQLIDDLNVGEVIYNFKKRNIDYVKKDARKIRIVLRQDEKVKRTILMELETLYADKNQMKMQYLFLEWFEKQAVDFEKAYREMKIDLNRAINSKHYKVYEIIKKSYQVK